MDTAADTLARLIRIEEKIDALLAAQRSSPPAQQAQGGEPSLPNYGRAKGRPIRGASMGDLEYYAAGCRKSLADEGKRRFWDKERVVLAAIESEIARQGGGAAQVQGAGADGDIPF